MRGPLLPGNITAAKATEVLPFGNMLYRLDITGVEVESMLEDGWKRCSAPIGKLPLDLYSTKSFVRPMAP